MIAFNHRYNRIWVLIGIIIGSGLLLGLANSWLSPWSILGITLGTIFCASTLLRPALLCYLIVGVVVLTSGMERGGLIPILKLNEVVLLVSAGMAMIIIFTRKPYQKVNLNPIGVAIIILVCGTTLIGGISYLVRGIPLTGQDGLALLAPLQYVLLFYIFTYLPSSNLERIRIIRFMLLCGAVVAIVGLLQAARFEPVIDLLHRWYASAQETNAVTKGRITSLMSAWNVLGIFLMVSILIAWAFRISRPTYLGRGSIGVVMGLCTACLMVSGSYAGLIGLVLGICIITFLLHGINRRTFIPLIALAISTIFAFVFFKPLIQTRLNYQFGYGGAAPETLVYRFGIWQEVMLPAIQQNLLWGVNPTIPTSYSWQSTESQYLTLLFSFGLIGFFAHLAWIAITMAWLIQRFRQHRGMLRPVSAVGIALLLVLSVAGFTNAVFTYSGTVDYLWIIFALLTTQEEVTMSTTADNSQEEYQWAKKVGSLQSLGHQAKGTSGITRKV